MDKKEFYECYIPALIKALDFDRWGQDFYLKGPEQFINLPENKIREIDFYLDKNAGKDSFLDKVAYYFDAKSHNFDKIQGILLKDYERELRKEIIKYKEKYDI